MGVFVFILLCDKGVRLIFCCGNIWYMLAVQNYVVLV